MKRTLLALSAGLVIGGATLGPLAASAAENATLRQRVAELERRIDIACDGLGLVEPSWHRYMTNRDAC